MNFEQVFTQCKELQDLRGVKSLKVIYCHFNGSLYRECRTAWQLMHGTFFFKVFKRQLKAQKLSRLNLKWWCWYCHYLNIKSVRKEWLFEITTFTYLSQFLTSYNQGYISERVQFFFNTENMFFVVVNLY